MFQNPRLLPWLTVLENVEVVLSKEQKNLNRAKDILSIMGLKKFLNYYPGQLSGGMQRRVALARSYSSQPELFYWMNLLFLLMTRWPINYATC